MLLIVLMFAEAVVGYSGFVYYESQFETTTTEKIEVGTEGENANAEYNDNDVSGINIMVTQFITKRNRRIKYGESIC